MNKENQDRLLAVLYSVKNKQTDKQYIYIFFFMIYKLQVYILFNIEIFKIFTKKEQRAMHLVAIQEKVAFSLLIYGFNIKRKNVKEKKEVLEVTIHLS